ncbi:MAG TPA: pentapeptide repeat-containing protein [Chitinophagaceae bacterium]|nr:pentapeptide repeat-containing protein [Chitinophagaceae bacterium]
MLNSNLIGNKIAEARKKMKLSQAELAQKILISPQAVGKWERGESMPDITTLNRLAEIFEVDLNFFSTQVQNEMVSIIKNEKSENLQFEELKSKPRKKFDWNWNMSRGNWVDADFSGLKNLQEKFSASNMKNTKFIGSELSDLIFQANQIDGCDFTRSDMRNSKILESIITKSVFEECILIDSEIRSSEIYQCNFSKVNFSGSEFRTTEFKNNRIENAIWKLTSFKTSSLTDLVFNGLVEDCIFENCSFSKVTFHQAILKNTFFKCRTLKNIKFIDCQADRMTYEFLKNGKANLTGLELLQ